MDKIQGPRSVVQVIDTADGERATAELSAFYDRWSATHQVNAVVPVVTPQGTVKLVCTANRFDCIVAESVQAARLQGEAMMVLQNTPLAAAAAAAGGGLGQGRVRR